MKNQLYNESEVCLAMLAWAHFLAKQKSRVEMVKALYLVWFGILGMLFPCSNMSMAEWPLKEKVFNETWISKEVSITS